MTGPGRDVDHQPDPEPAYPVGSGVLSTCRTCRETLAYIQTGARPVRGYWSHIQARTKAGAGVGR